jgi:hypothetical protein
MHASAVPVRPRPPPQAISTRSRPDRCHSPASARRASIGSAGSLKSGHRNHRDSHATGADGLPCRYSPKWGRGPSGSGFLSPRPRTSRPDGRRSTPCADSGHLSMPRMYARAPDARWTVRLVRLTDPYRDAFERWLCSSAFPAAGWGTDFGWRASRWKSCAEAPRVSGRPASRIPRRPGGSGAGGEEAHGAVAARGDVAELGARVGQ